VTIRVTVRGFRCLNSGCTRKTFAERRGQDAYARRQARYEEAARLKAAGLSLKCIAAAVGAERRQSGAGFAPAGHRAGSSRGGPAPLGRITTILTAIGGTGVTTLPSSGANLSRLASRATPEAYGSGPNDGARANQTP
jgi:hypothetical protein